MRFSLLLVVTVICLAQTPSPPAAISAYYRLAGNAGGPFPYQWLIVDSPLTLTFDGTSPHLRITGVGVTGATGPTGPQGAGVTVESGCSSAGGCTVLGTAGTIDIEPGVGTICVPQLSSAGVMTLQCSIDTAIVAYRVDPPIASGPCNNTVTNQPYGAGAWAADASYFYTCVPTGNPNKGMPVAFVWSRIQLTSGW
jgi:hypothetical protein